MLVHALPVVGYGGGFCESYQSGKVDDPSTADWSRVRASLELSHSVTKSTMAVSCTPRVLSFWAHLEHATPELTSLPNPVDVAVAHQRASRLLGPSGRKVHYDAPALGSERPLH